MTIRPIPGPWRIPPPFRPRHVDTAADDVTWVGTCDRCGHDATWRKTRDAIRPVCTCTCQPEESVA